MILVTGASGFIGSHYLAKLKARGQVARGLYRQAPLEGHTANLQVAKGHLLDSDALLRACEGISTVVHCAGYAHAFSDAREEAHRKHHAINAEGTRHLLRAAQLQGVRRFVFLSSVKAAADPGHQCVDESWCDAPETDYGRAKKAAEVSLLSAGNPLQVVILRLTMTYGAGGRGNLERMARLIQRGWFPPIPETGNRRSLVHVDDVVSAIDLATNHPAAAGETLIVTGNEAPSGHRLYQLIRATLGLPPKHWSLPAPLWRAAGWSGNRLQRITGRPLPMNSEVVDRLLNSACYSSRKLQTTLGWRPQVSLNEGLQRLLNPDSQNH